MTQEDYDVIIFGTGPAGLQAAIHTARKKVKVLVVGKFEKSSLFHAHVENFCCIFDLPGEQMLKVGKEQGQRFGAEFLDEDVLHVEAKAPVFHVETESGTSFSGKTLILATGTARNCLGVPGEKRFLGRGVSYCVECDANFFKGEDVAVIGGESAAASGVLTLVHDTRSVHMIYKILNVTSALKERLLQSNAILHEGVEIKEIFGKTQVEGVFLKDGTQISVSGVFIELGAKGVMELATSLGLRLDDTMRYIQTNKSMETSVPGIFAAGDICGPPWQMAKAVGEGCIAGIAAANYAKGLNLSD